MIFYGNNPLLLTNSIHLIAYSYFFQLILYTSEYDPGISQWLLLKCMKFVSDEFSTINFLEKIPSWQ